MITELFNHINQNIARIKMRQDSHQIFYCTREPSSFFLCNISWIFHSNNRSHYYHRQTFCLREEKENSRRTGAKIFFKLKPLKPSFWIYKQQLVYSWNILMYNLFFSNINKLLKMYIYNIVLWYMFNWDLIFIKCVKEVSYNLAVCHGTLDCFRKMITIKYALCIIYATL